MTQTIQSYECFLFSKNVIRYTEPINALQKVKFKNNQIQCLFDFIFLKKLSASKWLFCKIIIRIKKHPEFYEGL